MSSDAWHSSATSTQRYAQSTVTELPTHQSVVINVLVLSPEKQPRVPTVEFQRSYGRSVELT